MFKKAFTVAVFLISTTAFAETKIKIQDEVVLYLLISFVVTSYFVAKFVATNF